MERTKKIRVLRVPNHYNRKAAPPPAQSASRPALAIFIAGAPTGIKRWFGSANPTNLVLKTLQKSS
jgi:hypothetical protein